MEKQRKFLLVLPLLVLPFMTMAFWALGGGKSHDQTVQAKGLDTNLPAAQFKSKTNTDKMALYQAAQHDQRPDGVSPAFLHAMGLDSSQQRSPGSAGSPDEQAERLQAKLSQLNKQLDEPQGAPLLAAPEEPEPQKVRQLKRMMRNMDNQSGADPEMQQLNRMLDKIQAIQNPVTVRPKAEKTEILKPFRAIPAMIDGKQKVADGAAVKLKLTDTATIKGQLLPEGQEIFGFCEITNQRLMLTIQNIRLGNQIIPVNLTVYSLDGMAGIPAPEAELCGAAGDGADNALQSMQLLSMDQSIGTQAALSGVNAAKNLFSKKVRKIRVKLKNELPLLLKSSH